MSLSKFGSKKNNVTFSSDISDKKQKLSQSSNPPNQSVRLTKSEEKEIKEEISKLNTISEFREDSSQQIETKLRNSYKRMSTFKKPKINSDQLQKKNSLSSTKLIHIKNRDNKEDYMNNNASNKLTPEGPEYDVKALPSLSPTSVGSTRGNIRVYARVRPINEVEADLLENKIGILCIENVANTPRNETVLVKNANGFSSGPYTFDKIFSPETPQERVYSGVGKEIAHDILSGYNGTIFAYGQSGSGKTHTMYGQDIHDYEERGIIPRLIADLFNYVETSGENITFQFKMSILQIYKEVIYDLLTGERDLKIKENPVRGIYVEKLTEVYINTIESFMSYVDLSITNKIVSETKLNSTSSRSHSILILEVTQTFVNENYTKKGTLNLVDLAGSEKISKTGAVGETLEEAKKINLSLSSLGHVIHSLTSGADHIPYRDSKLTRILQESLGGNFKTSLIVTCSPHSYHYEETVSSFQFGQRAKFIKNKVKINIKLSYEELQKIITKLRKALSKANNEILRLKGLLPPGTEVNVISLDEDNNYNQQETFKEPSLHNLTGLESKTSIEKETMASKSKQIENTLYSMVNVTDENEDISSKENTVKAISSIRVSEVIKEQEDKVISTEGNCLKCMSNQELINQLKNKIDSLKNKVKEKDDIISALNNSNDNKVKQINELRLKIKTSSKMASVPLIEEEKEIKTIDDLYKEIQAKLSNIEMKQIESIKYGLTYSKFNELTPQLIKDLQNLYHINTKTSFNESSSNGHILLFNSVTQLLSKGLGIYKDQSSSDIDFINMTEVFKAKTAEIFDEIFIFANHEIDKTAVDSINKELKTKLIYLNCVYLFGYLQAYSSLQIHQQLNHKLINQNNILKNMNLILITIVEDLLRSNIDISQKCNVIELDVLKSRIVGKNIVATETDEYDSLRRYSFADSFSNQPFKRRSGRIMTLVNSKAQEASNILKKKLSGKNCISLFNKPELGNSFVQGSNPPISNDAQMKSNDYQQDAYKSNNHLQKGLLPSQNTVHLINENKQSMQYPIQANSTTGEFIKKQEKKKSKLTILKEYIVKSIQKTEDYKNDLMQIKDHVINLVQITQSNILSKLYQNGLIKEINVNYDTCIENQNEKDASLQQDEEEHEEMMTTFPKKTRNKLAFSLSKKKDFDSLSIPFSDENQKHNNGFNRFNTMTCDSDIRNNPFQLEQSQAFFNHSSYDFSNFNRNLNTNQRNIEALIEEYLEIGTATRKFDGISVKYEGSKVKYSYESGLNARNSIYSNPIHKKLASNAGDISQVSVDNDDDDDNPE